MQLVKITPVKTYKTEANAIKAVEAKLGTGDTSTKAFPAGLRYMVVKTEEGRYYPLFIGESAVHAGVHFHFNVVG